MSSGAWESSVDCLGGWLLKAKFRVNWRLHRMVESELDVRLDILSPFPFGQLWSPTTLLTITRETFACYRHGKFLNKFSLQLLQQKCIQSCRMLVCVFFENDVEQKKGGGEVEWAIFRIQHYVNVMWSHLSNIRHYLWTSSAFRLDLLRRGAALCECLRVHKIFRVESIFNKILKGRDEISFLRLPLVSLCHVLFILYFSVTQCDKQKCWKCLFREDFKTYWRNKDSEIQQILSRFHLSFGVSGYEEASSADLSCLEFFEIFMRSEETKKLWPIFILKNTFWSRGKLFSH